MSGLHQTLFIFLTSSGDFFNVFREACFLIIQELALQCLSKIIFTNVNSKLSGMASKALFEGIDNGSAWTLDERRSCAFWPLRCFCLSGPLAALLLPFSWSGGRNQNGRSTGNKGAFCVCVCARACMHA